MTLCAIENCIFSLFDLAQFSLLCLSVSSPRLRLSRTLGENPSDRVFEHEVLAVWIHEMCIAEDAHISVLFSTSVNEDCSFYLSVRPLHTEALTGSHKHLKITACL